MTGIPISALGTGVMLFLLSAGMHLLIGILAPALAFRSVSDRSILFVSTRTDTRLYGATPAEVLTVNPALTQLRRTLLTAISGLLVGMGLLEVALAWFGLGGGHGWALLALAGSGAAMLPYWYLVFRPYRAAAIPLSIADLPPFIWFPAALLVPATVAGWIGLS